MADEKIYTVIEADLSTESSEKLTQGLSDAIEKGLEGKEDSFNKVFNFKNIKKDLGDALNKAWGNSSKVQKRQSNAMEKYSKAQGVVTGLVNQQNKGFGGTAKLVAAIGKQGIAGAAGMAANLNPYVLGMKAAAMAAKFTADQFVRIAKESAKFIGQGSLFTDRETITMMQKTGQTATQAQGTQRALGDLGLNFEDIQSGKITAEQAAAFEKIRQRELEKLEEINTVAGPMFKSMQQVTLGFTLLLRDINDFITIAMASAPGITSMLEKIKPFIAQVGGFMGDLIGTYLGPIFSIIGTIVSLVMDILSGIMPAMQSVMVMVKPFLNYAVMGIEVVGKILGTLSKAFSSLLPLFNIFLGGFKILGKLLEFLTPILEKVSEFVTTLSEGIQTFISGLFETLKSIPVIGDFLFGDVSIPAAAGAGSSTTNNSSFSNSSTTNYIYGSNSMSQSSTSPSDLFSNSYVLVND